MLQPSNKFDLKTQEDILVKQTVPVYNESTLLQWSSTQNMFRVEHAQKMKNGHDWQTGKET